MSDNPDKRRGQWQAAGLMLVVALPMLAAYVIYQTGWGIPEGTVNKGQLLDTPKALSDVSLTLSDGSSWQIESEPRHWRYVIPGTGECDQACMDNLYLTRQVHIRLNEKADRVERIYLLLGERLSPELARHIEQEHPKLRVMRARREAFETLMTDTQPGGNRYFLMDQEGYLMMRYGPDDQGNELLKDIKKMLKVTYEDQL